MRYYFDILFVFQFSTFIGFRLICIFFRKFLYIDKGLLIHTNFLQIQNIKVNHILTHIGIQVSLLILRCRTSNTLLDILLHNQLTKIIIKRFPQTSMQDNKSLNLQCSFRGMYFFVEIIE